jgi:hypothetical protein
VPLSHVLLAILVPLPSLPLSLSIDELSVVVRAISPPIHRISILLASLVKPQTLVALAHLLLDQSLPLVVFELAPVAETVGERHEHGTVSVPMAVLAYFGDSSFFKGGDAHTVLLAVGV